MGVQKIFFETLEINEMTHRKRQERRESHRRRFKGRVTGQGPEKKNEI